MPAPTGVKLIHVGATIGRPLFLLFGNQKAQTIGFVPFDCRPRPKVGETKTFSKIIRQ